MTEKSNHYKATSVSKLIRGLVGGSSVRRLVFKPRPVREATVTLPIFQAWCHEATFSHVFALRTPLFLWFVGSGVPFRGTAERSSIRVFCKTKKPSQEHNVLRSLKELPPCRVVAGDNLAIHTTLYFYISYKYCQ